MGYGTKLETRNSKFERNEKPQTRNPRSRMVRLVAVIAFLTFLFPLDFEFRILSFDLSWPSTSPHN